VKRLLWEVIIVLILGAAIYGVWRWSAVETTRKLEAEQTQWQTKLLAVEHRAQESQANAARDQATAVFRAFVAGIQPAIFAGRSEAITQAVNQLLSLPRIAFVHVLTPSGEVLATSNGKYASAGRADERASWALGLKEMGTRQGELSGTVEVAGPIVGGSGPLAVVWISYKDKAEPQHPAAASPKDGEKKPPAQSTEGDGSSI